MPAKASKNYQTELEERPDFITGPNEILYRNIIDEADNPEGEHPYIHGITQKLYDMLVKGDGHDPPGMWKRAKEKVARKLCWHESFEKIHEHIGEKASFCSRMECGDQVYCWSRAEDDVARDCLITLHTFYVHER